MNHQHSALLNIIDSHNRWHDRVSVNHDDCVTCRILKEKSECYD